ncbi:MAG: hypothetical protein ACK56F_15205, partial [bacterium]
SSNGDHKPCGTDQDQRGVLMSAGTIDEADGEDQRNGIPATRQATATVQTHSVNPGHRQHLVSPLIQDNHLATFQQPTHRFRRLLPVYLPGSVTGGCGTDSSSP